MLHILLMAVSMYSPVSLSVVTSLIPLYVHIVVSPPIAVFPPRISSSRRLSFLVEAPRKTSTIFPSTFTSPISPVVMNVSCKWSATRNTMNHTFEHVLRGHRFLIRPFHCTLPWVLFVGGIGRVDTPKREPLPPIPL